MDSLVPLKEEEMNNKTDTKAKTEKLQHLLPVTSPIVALTTLCSQMQAAGHGPDHPWPYTLAGIIAAMEDEPHPSALAHAIDSVNVSDVATCIVKNSLQPVLAAIEALANFDSTDILEFQQRLREIQALARVGRRLGEDAINTIDCEREDARDKLAALQGRPA